MQLKVKIDLHQQHFFTEYLTPIEKIEKFNPQLLLENLITAINRKSSQIFINTDHVNLTNYYGNCALYDYTKSVTFKQFFIC